MGCGNGILGQWARETFGCKVWGTEISTVAAAMARQRGYEEVVRHSLESTSPPYPGRQFDLAVLCATVEHLFAPENAIRQAWAALRDEGVLLLVTPNVTWVVNRLLFLFGHWESSLLGGTPGHIRYLNQVQLCDLLLSNGFHRLNWSHSVGLVLPANNRALVKGLSFRVPAFLVGRAVRRWQSLWAENFIVVATKGEAPTSSAAAPLRGGTDFVWRPDQPDTASDRTLWRGDLPLYAYALGVVLLTGLVLLVLSVSSPMRWYALTVLATGAAAACLAAGVAEGVRARKGFRFRRIWQRALEAASASVLLLAASPLLLAVGVATRVSAGSSHVGRIEEGPNGRQFMRLRFATGPKGALKTTRLGTWLERTGLARGPSLINVLRGRIGLFGRKDLSVKVH
jgi:SAM-dependent methyltransferase